MMPERTFATVDHIIPTDNRKRPFQDNLAEGMVKALKEACEQFGITFFDVESGRQGIVHIIGPELGLTQPGMTIACGDSHTSTHGAFGAIAMGIGTTQVRDVLATQCLAVARLKVRRIEVSGALGPGVYAKDIILHVIRKLGVFGGTGVAYVNPDAKTFEYMKGRPYAPKGDAWDRAVEHWKTIASDADASYDDVVRIDASEIAPTVTWGINPGQAISVKEKVPTPDSAPNEAEKSLIEEALGYMQLRGGAPIEGTPIQVAFIGSCTNGRLSDF